MTDKERLEFIKEKHEKQGAQSDDYWGFVHDDVNFLIEQAERVQELEGNLNDVSVWNHGHRVHIHKLKQQNKRYREALEKILVNRQVFHLTQRDLISSFYEIAQEGLEDTE